ncbi:MAG: serine/threonine protein kinase [Cyanobacteria bacterium SZAS-4]|nr:serine/threonine protein kinase [Cyanobacteria bacterium SZAS-4]
MANAPRKVDGIFVCSCENPDPKNIPNFQRDRNKPEPVELDLASIGIPPETFPLERYIPIGVLGLGPKADVILARDKQSGNKVAVKSFKKIAQSAFATFEQEAKKNKKLSHNNIARLLEAFIYELKTPYLVSEYKDGFSVEQYLAIHGIPSHDVAVMILISICEALIYAKKESLMHMNIRPGNVIFLDDMNADPSISLTDFTLPKIKALEELTEPSDALYMSAEEARNMEYDERSEVYSIGCVGYALLAGKPPFQDGTARDIKNSHALKLPARICNVNFVAERPKDLEEVIERCLEKDPRVRFDTVEQLLERLQVFPRREKMQIAAILAAKQKKKFAMIGAAVAAVGITCALGYLALHH